MPAGKAGGQEIEVADRQILLRPRLTIWADMANAIWALQQKSCDPTTAERREEFRPLARYIERLSECMSEIGLEVQSHTNQAFDSGQSLEVIAFQPTAGISREIVVETIRPTVYLKGHRVQVGQVIVATPENASRGEELEMSRLTIDFGIDLGTTNSSIAVLEKNGPRIIRNNDNWQFTPSTVWVDKNGAVRVGMSAKERAFSDPENGAAEFKLMMGKAYSKPIARLNRSLTAEELSAEVLKSLKDDVRRESGEDLEAAVITVPAAFDQPESEATRRAAQIAGIKFSPAASRAYCCRSGIWAPA